MHKGKFRLHLICLMAAGNDSCIKGFTVLLQPGYKVLKPVLETEGTGPGGHRTGCLAGRVPPQIVQGYLQTLCQERCLPEPFLQNIPVPGNGRENVLVRHKGHCGAVGPLTARTQLFYRGCRYAAFIRLGVGKAVLVHLHMQMGGQRIDYRSPHTVKAS